MMEYLSKLENDEKKKLEAERKKEKEKKKKGESSSSQKVSHSLFVHLGSFLGSQDSGPRVLPRQRSLVIALTQIIQPRSNPLLIIETHSCLLPGMTQPVMVFLEMDKPHTHIITLVLSLPWYLFCIRSYLFFTIRVMGFSHHPWLFFL